MVADEMSRFMIWAANIGAHLDWSISSSLDHRLRNTTRIFDVPEDTLQATAPDLDPHNDPMKEGIGHKDTPNVTTAKDIAMKLSEGTLLSVHAMIGQLKRMSNTIKRASIAEYDLQAARTRDTKYGADSDDDYEMLARKIVEHKFKVTTETPSDTFIKTQDALTNGVEFRMRRFKDWERHHKRQLDREKKRNPTRPTEIDKSPIVGDGFEATQPHSSKSSAVPLSVGRLSERASEVESTVLSQRSFDSKLFEIPESINQFTNVSRSVRSIMGKTYVAWPCPPKTPNYLSRNDNVKCPYCFDQLDNGELENKTAWRKHVKRDLEPYNCLHPQCQEYLRMFASEEQWSNHIKNFHSQQTWVCRLKPHLKAEVFQDEATIREHLQQRHKGMFPDSMTETLMKSMHRSSEISLFEECPLNCSDQPSMSEENHLTNHIANHLLSLAMEALPERSVASSQSTFPEDDSDQSGDISATRSQLSRRKDMNEMPCLEFEGGGTIEGINEPHVGRTSAIAIGIQKSIHTWLRHIGSPSPYANHWKILFLVFAFIARMRRKKPAQAFETTPQAPRGPNTSESSMKTTVDYEIYTVGWICAIQAELVAALEILDEEIMEPVPVSRHDGNSYTLGKIGNHHVVVAGLPRGQYGVASAAKAARDMVRTFPNVRVGFMVGIGGGVPTQGDIRLGDIVVGSSSYGSGGLLQYNHKKTIKDRGMDLIGDLNLPPVSVLGAISKLAAYHERKGHNLNQTVEDVLSKNPRLIERGFQRPHDNTDRLYKAKFTHPYHGAKCSDACPTSNLEKRVPRMEYEDNPKIHYGLIASSSHLMNDAVTRDELADQENVLCFETEAAGLPYHFPCVVIRGISDYSDSHRGREWQGYAALVAAAYAKQLLLQIPAWMIKEEKRVKIILNELDKKPVPMSKTNKATEGFDRNTKREDEMRILDWLNAIDYSSKQHELLQPQQRQPGTGQSFVGSERFQAWLKSDDSVLVCCGMPGAGKTITTAIAIEYLQSRFKDDPTVGVAYVYCSYQKSHQQNSQDVFTSFLKQLALHQSRLPTEIHKLYEKNDNGNKTPLFEDIITTLRDVMNSFSKTFIIVDALDEKDSWESFMSDMLELRGQTAANIFITSRPNLSLQEKMQDFFIYDIQADDEDMGLYIDQRVKQMMVLSDQNTELSDKVKQNFRNLIREKLNNATKGIFLLARIYLDNLQEETNLKGISIFLENLPTGLRAYEDAYEKTIRRIRNQGQKHRDLAQRALTWLTFAREPLSKGQFRHALSVDEGLSELKDEDLVSTNITLHVCMDLVKIEERSDTVSLLHYTTMEYLKANPNHLLSLGSSDDPKFIANPSDSEIERSMARGHYETTIATASVTYLLFEGFRTGQCGSEKEHRSRLREHPLYSYAARNWGYHARKGGPCSKTIEFLKSETHVSASSQCLPIFRSGIDSRGSWSSARLGRVTGLHLTAYFGLERETMSLLSRGMEPDVRDGWGRTPLSYASERGHVDVVTQLLDFGVDPESEGDWESHDLPRTALSHAAKNGHAGVVKLLLEKGRVRPDSNPSVVEGRPERTPLSFATEDGHQDVVKILIDAHEIALDPESHISSTPSLHATQSASAQPYERNTAAESSNITLYATGVQTPNSPANISRGYSGLPQRGNLERFACPFHKLDPVKHQSCEHYSLTNWYHTHQHLSRVHTLGIDFNHAAYCAICRIPYKGKNAEAEWQHHLRAGQCMHASMEETGKLLPVEFIKLARLGTGLSSEQRWYAAWDKLFPHLAKPSSPYFESRVDLLRRHAYKRIQRSLGYDDPAAVNKLVDELFSSPDIPQTVPQSQFLSPDTIVSPSPAAGPSNWFTSPSQISSAGPGSSAASYSAGDFPIPDMLLSPDFSMHPSPVTEATAVLGPNPFSANCPGVFFDPCAPPSDQDFHTDQGYMGP
ncbi:unnamed protein product [Fusarium graminearum]|uniref:Chromosome 2, complete genome n=1 Tax=Gibberella zeae (strain ATCC MYA-4620 / CBS 123657 / FGSC 9075 / NRRL 31084 / PH-1) TaxID=229533 RepID=A0A098DKN6_GIBZE|nr:unnamed protein product [Fusarium graminearum]